jgi:hypothetical protein
MTGKTMHIRVHFRNVGDPLYPRVVLPEGVPVMEGSYKALVEKATKASGLDKVEIKVLSFRQSNERDLETIGPSNQEIDQGRSLIDESQLSFRGGYVYDPVFKFAVPDNWTHQNVLDFQQRLQAEIDTVAAQKSVKAPLVGGPEAYPDSHKSNVERIFDGPHFTVG